MDGTQNEVLQESEFVKMLVRSRVISDGQLKAVYDYQRSVGGSVLDILVKLNMMPRAELEGMLQAARRGEDVATAAPAGTNVAIDPDKLDTDELKLHHRLIDKIPTEIVERYLLTVFFPAANLDSRKLIVGHGRELPEGMSDRIRSTLGVDLYTLDLDEDIAADFVVAYLERAKKPVSEEVKSLLATRRRAEPATKTEVAVARGESGSASETAPEGQESFGSETCVVAAARKSSSADVLPSTSMDDQGDDDTWNDDESDFAGDDHATQDSAPGVSRPMNEPSKSVESTGACDPHIEWTALLNLLVKKSVLTHEEVRVEIELLKRNQTR